MKKLFFNLFVLGLLLIQNNAFSQDFYGFRQSNYSGVSGGDLNPANIADNRMAVDITLGGASFTTYNNYAYFNPYKMPGWWLETIKDTTRGSYFNDTTNYAWNIVPYGNTKDSMNAGKGRLFEFENAKGEPYAFTYNHSVEILNFMVSVSPKMAFSFGIKQRTFLNVDNVSPELVTLSVNSLEYSSLWNQELNDKLLNISFNTWNEYKLGFGMVAYDKEEHFLKAGIGVKYLQGLAAAYLYTDEVKYDLLNADTATTIKGHFNYGYSSNIDSLIAGSTNFNKDFYGKGFGIDLGFVYEWRPNWKDYKYDMDGETNLWRKDQNKYKLKFSFAVNDIGGIKYNKSENSRDFKVDIHGSFTNPSTLFALSSFNDTKGLASFNENVDTLTGKSNADGSAQANYLEDPKQSFFMNIPTHITTSVDYHIWNDFYVNLGGFVGLAMKKDPHKVKYPSSITLTPRYDYKWAGVSVPVSYGGLTGFRTGLGLRMGPIIIGTANLRPIFAPGKDKKLNGADFYFALKVPILRTHPKDMDNDKVSDKLDLCKETPGVWEFKGCPDTDGDGIQDSEDACPTEAGLREFQGCPDRDGDKVIDSKDDCPDDAGKIEFNGCPDKDDDKIIDKNDDCPDVFGIAAFNGCPDTDGDGIKDSEDLCPQNAGPVENQGCPDTDNDGIFDYLDECPTEAGPQDNHGCPWPDTDGDGLLDKDDKCPYNAGPAKNQGCPYVDTDGDGVLDKDDDCVNTPGPVENKGCPKVDLEVIKRAFDALQFETAKAVIKDESYASLEDLAKYLVDNPTFRIKIAGHTDSQGAAQANLILSKKRAEAVRDFLESRGVAADRMIVQYFGEEKPIATNDTKEGREKNRRVEMEIIFE
jgi:outer membrane protein OmpA-like peptidoglycan-associated protein